MCAGVNVKVRPSGGLLKHEICFHEAVRHILQRNSKFSIINHIIIHKKKEMSNWVIFATSRLLEKSV